MLSVIIVFGELPNISSKAKSIGLSPLVLDSKVKRLSFVTSPTVYIGERSRSEILFKVSMCFSAITNPIRS